MTANEQLIIVQKAVEKKDLKNLFLGAPEYNWGNLKHIPANVNTDIGAILEQGLYILYRQGNFAIPEMLKAAVYELIDGTPAEIWTAYQIIWCQNWDIKHTQAAFSVVDSNILDVLKLSVESNQNALSACKDLVGWNLQKGLWEDIVRLEKNLKNKYGAGLIW